MKTHEQSDIIYSKVDNAQKISYLQQIIENYSVSADFWQNNTLPGADPALLNTLELICIQLPITGLKVHQIVESIENDFIERGYYNAHL